MKYCTKVMEKFGGFLIKIFIFYRKFDFIFPKIHGSLIVKLDYYRLHASLVFLIGVIYIARPQRTRINII